MPVAIVAKKKSIPSYIAKPKINIRFRVMRDGVVTPHYKLVTIYRSFNDVARVCLALETLDGEFTASAAVDLETMLANDDWLVVGVDNVLPRRIRSAYLKFIESGTYFFNITSGEGGGQQGDPAQVDARVRVERVPASREVVLVERPFDGEWRIAGYGPTPGGSGEIDLRVVGGDVYALAVDDYGVRFVADLAVQVGQRIRPTQYSGWVYEITEAGQLPSVEPAWWAAIGENPSQPLGTARAVARRYFQPIALGPGPVEVI